MNHNSLANHNDTHDHPLPPWYIWPLAQASTSFCLLVEAYVFISLLIFGLRTGKLRRNPKKPRCRILMTLACICPCSYIFSLSMTQTQLITVAMLHRNLLSEQNSSVCDVVICTKTAAYYASVLSTYAFFWYRQRVWLSNPLCSKYNTRVVRVLSGASISVIAVGGAFSVVIGFVRNAYHMEPH